MEFLAIENIVNELAIVYQWDLSLIIKIEILGTLGLRFDSFISHYIVLFFVTLTDKKKKLRLIKLINHYKPT